MKLRIVEDDIHDTIEIEGVKYACSAFIALGFAPVGSWLRIDERRDGTLTVRRVSNELNQKFDRECGIKP